MEYLETVNKNVFPGKWDTIFDQQLNYNLKHKDVWIGYQLTKNKKQIKSNEYRQFVQYRYLENNFKERPIDYLLQIDRNYQNLKANFLSFTLVRQSVYRTRYLYGLGRYEDLPIGQSLTWTTGHSQIEKDRSAYLGFKFEQYKLSKKRTTTILLQILQQVILISHYKTFDFLVAWSNLVN